MTTEIAVANRWGVAIAADSAVTIEQLHKGKPTEKVYNSANKLFTLSKHHPIGVMVYNGLTLGGTPWETIIKIIRRELKDTQFFTVEDYAKFLFQFLASHKMLFHEKQTREVVERNIYRVIYEIVGRELERSDGADQVDHASMASLMNDAAGQVEQFEHIEGFGDDFAGEFFSDYADEFARVLDYVAPKHGDVPAFREAAIRLIGAWFTRKVRIPGYSGVVVCGFGSNDVFPKLFEYYADTIVCNRVRHWLNQSKAIDSDSASFVLPFADSEVIDTLTNGINPIYYHKFGDEIFKMISGLPDLLVSQISELSDEQKRKYARLLKQSIIKPYRELEAELREFRETEYAHPIESTLQVLPISELAIVAETFINAAQIHKRVNPVLDTVGGPVDVAVISKGDGFVWVKRKHYFDPKLNPAFIQKYLEGWQPDDYIPVSGLGIGGARCATKVGSRSPTGRRRPCWSPRSRTSGLKAMEPRIANRTKSRQRIGQSRRSKPILPGA